MGLYVGIDGGGTRTRAVVAGADLVPLGRGASGPANAATRPLPRVVETVQEAAADALAAAGGGDGEPSRVAIGLAGIDSIHDRRPLLVALESVFGVGRVLLTSDARAALAGASRDGLDAPAVVLIAGTGAIAFGQGRDGATARAGGYGSVIGDEGSGFAQLARHFASERLVLAAQAYAGAQRALDLTIEWCRARETFGRALIRHQIVQHTLTEMARRTDVARSYAHDVARRSLTDDVSAQVCFAKNTAVEAGQWIVDQAVQLHGGMGYMRESEVERQYRDMRILGIGGGTSEILTGLAAKRLGYTS